MEGAYAGDETKTSYDLKTILCSDGRDFLIRNNGDEVKVVEHLKGKIVGVYFSAHWCGPCRRFTPKLADVYREVNAVMDGRVEFEIVFVSGDRSEDDFREYFSGMPWLAVPFSDSATRQKLDELFEVQGIPHLVVLDGATGALVTDDAVEIIREYGPKGYPFTPERVKTLEEEEEEAKKNQTIKSILASSSRDYVISGSGSKVPLTELEGKVVGIYFSDSGYGSCAEFTPILSKMYTELKSRGESFEVVLVSLDEEEDSFNEALQGMSWLALPFKDSTCERLTKYFELRTLPTVVLIGHDGKTLDLNVAQLVEEHGIEAYPFSPEKIAKLAEIEKLREQSQTLETLLVSGDLDHVLARDGSKVLVKELVGKIILIYFSAHWCPPCRDFTPKLVKVYQEIKDQHSEFEVVFVSSDRDQTSFDGYFSEMPWLALPFGDARKKFLSRKFKLRGIPSLVAIDPSGRTVTKDARLLVMVHGSQAFPFTNERLKELEEEEEKKASNWPEKVKHELHNHVLVKTKRRSYGCDGCRKGGSGWSFYCSECDFDLHPDCALASAAVVNGEAEEREEGEEEKKEGFICEGDVCRKA